jgi:hypothetical protein
MVAQEVEPVDERGEPDRVGGLGEGIGRVVERITGTPASSAPVASSGGSGMP